MEPFISITRDEGGGTGLAERAKPEIKTAEATDTYGKFLIEPLERGFGITLGNPLRRVLLGSIPGTAVTWVKVEGALHEYSTLPGIKEEVLEFIQNVKKIRLRSQTSQPSRMHLEVTGPGEVLAGDIVTPSGVEIVNPELHLATLDSSEGKLIVDFNLEQGRGYKPATQGDGLSIGVLPVDAIFSPVRKANYSIELTRVEQVTDYERLVLEVWTDGTLTPVDAVRRAAETLVDHLFLFSGVGKRLEAKEKPSPARFIPAEVYNTPIDRLELSSRTFNSLKRASLNKVGDVLERTREDLMKIRNFGEKSLEELYNRLRERNFPLPEDVHARGDAEEQEGEG